MGLVNQISTPEKLMEDAIAFAETIASRPPIAVGAVLKAMSAGQYEGIDAGLDSEQESSKIVAASKDSKEGIAAFMEKRAPKFTGE